MKNLSKRLKIFTMSLLVTVTVVPSANASPSQSTTPVVGDATKVATDYFKSYVSKDVDGMIQNSVDALYSNDHDRRVAYEEQVKTDTPVTDFKIVETTAVSDSEVDLSVEFTTVDAVLPPIPYEVKKIDSNWKVVLEPKEINADKNSADYGEVKSLDAKKLAYVDFNSGKVTPFATTLDYYSFENWAGNDLIGIDTFNTTNTWVSIQGWQYDNHVNRPTTLSVKYEIITNLNGNILWYGQKTIDGSYYKSGPQYYGVINLTQNRISNARVRISSVNAMAGYGAGNVYEP